MLDGLFVTLFALMLPLVLLVFVMAFWHGWSEFSEMQSAVLRLQETVHIQNETIKNLRSEIDTGRRTRDAQIEELRQALRLKDQEIERLTRMYNDLLEKYNRGKGGF
jgi:predicted RNase H-like nuclease (RuvC/YqgF family)